MDCGGKVKLSLLFNFVNTTHNIVTLNICKTGSWFKWTRAGLGKENPCSKHRVKYIYIYKHFLRSFVVVFLDGKKKERKGWKIVL